MTERVDNPAIPAATVILVRDVDGSLETLMLHKTTGQSFGGHWVFPGGKVEPSEGEGEDGARRAAIREAAEETGLAIPDDALVPFSRWTPPPQAPKRFSTWFFIAAAPLGEVLIDGGEIGDHVWTTPADALARHAAQEIELAPPTWVTLNRLSGWADSAAALAGAAAEPIVHYETHIGRSGDGLAAVWTGDAAYESGDLDTPGPRHRLVMAREGGWQYERSP